MSRDWDVSDCFFLRKDTFSRRERRLRRFFRSRSTSVSLKYQLISKLIFFKNVQYLKFSCFPKRFYFLFFKSSYLFRFFNNVNFSHSSKILFFDFPKTLIIMYFQNACDNSSVTGFFMSKFIDE